MRPVFAGAISGESLLDGTVDLAYIALLNDGLDVKAENEYRAQKAFRNG